MKKWLAYIIVCVTFANPIFAQRHLPDLQIFATNENLQLDTIAEYPAINNGISSAAVPDRGENLSVQIFIPRSSGLLGFGCTVTFANPNNSLTRAFQILSVTDWHQQPLRFVTGSQTISYYYNRLAFSPVPSTGHIATVLLTPRQEIKSPLPIKLDCSITVVSSPPRRVWQMQGTKTLHWQ